MKKIWPFSFYFLYYAAIATYAPYIVLYLQSIGLTGAQIGTLMGLLPLITILSTPFWTGLADRTNRHRSVMSLTMLVGIACLATLPFLNTYFPVFILAVALNAFFPSVIPLADSASMFMLADHGELYGRLRLGGTIGFGLTATLAGALVQNYGLRIAFWGAATLFACSLLVSQKFEHSSTTVEPNRSSGKISQLLVNPRWLLFLLLGMTCGSAFSATHTYFFPYMKNMGAGETIMGLALSIGTVVEIPVLLFVNRLILRFKPFKLLVFSMIATGLRLLGFALAPNPTVVILVQLLNGFTFPVTIIAGVSYAAENAPDGLRASAQGQFNAVMSGFGAAIGGFSGGILFERIGGPGLYLVYTLVVFAVLLLVTLAWRKLPPIPSSTISRA
jgi:PPP family 3-phenylpropionic acid transporter